MPCCWSCSFLLCDRNWEEIFKRQPPISRSLISCRHLVAMFSTDSISMRDGRLSSTSLPLPRSLCIAFIACQAIISLPVRTTADNFTVVFMRTLFRPRLPSHPEGPMISGAMGYAVYQINNDPDLLAGHRLKFDAIDTAMDQLTALRVMSEKWREGSVAFFGPEESCEVEGILAAAWNLPIAAYVSQSGFSLIKFHKRTYYSLYSTSSNSSSVILKTSLSFTLERLPQGRQPNLWPHFTRVDVTSSENCYKPVIRKWEWIEFLVGWCLSSHQPVPIREETLESGNFFRR